MPNQPLSLIVAPDGDEQVKIRPGQTQWVRRTDIANAIEAAMAAGDVGQAEIIAKFFGIEVK